MMREPAVAGSFYPADADLLSRELTAMIRPSTPLRSVMGVVSPHAGYVYSGGIAGQLYGGIVIPETVVILGPNHHGRGAPVAVAPSGSWSTPLGSVPIDSELAGLILEEVEPAREDEAAHRYEHSLEVQVPFLRFLRPDVRIVPICLGFGGFEGCRIVGEGLARGIRRAGRPILMVASSDMTHYEAAAAAKEKDQDAIQAMLDMDAERLYEVCRRRGITMCGVVPAAVMLVACRELGAREARLVAYGTSGDVTGDQGSVVAYAALEVW
jgi:hypothetical protein